jgi:hypothetical protein
LSIGSWRAVARLVGVESGGEAVSFVLTTKELGFPAIDTTITFTRVAEHTYRVRYSNPPPAAEYLMLYSGFYFCAVQKLALDNGFDRFALLADQDSPQNDSAQAGITVFLKPGEEASKVLEPRFVGATFGSVDWWPRLVQPSPVRRSNRNLKPAECMMRRLLPT